MHIAKYVFMKLLFNPFYYYAKNVILCSRHLVSGNEQEKKSSCIYDNLMYTDSKQSKKWHWEILKLFQSSILNAQISLKLKCFAWVTITLCRCSGQGYKRITSGMDMNFFIHLTPLKPNASRNKNFEATHKLFWCISAGLRYHRGVTRMILALRSMRWWVLQEMLNLAWRITDYFKITF